MSESVTIWEKDSTGNIYTRPGGAGRVSVWAHKANRLRRGKHLTDAEAAAEYWAATSDSGRLEGAISETRIRREDAVYRFATHDQAV